MTSPAAISLGLDAEKRHYVFCQFELGVGAAQEVLPEEAGFDSVAAGLDSAADFDSPADEPESEPGFAEPESELDLSELDPPEGLAA
jgi:hypothetical protein